MLAVDAVVVDPDTQGVEVQWSESSNSDDFAKNLIRARCEGRFGTSVLESAGCRLLRPDRLMTPRGVAVFSRFSATSRGLASVKTARPRSCAPRRRDLRRHPKCPVAQL